MRYTVFRLFLNVCEMAKFCFREACGTHDKLRTVYCPKTCGVCMGEEVEECEDHHPTGECQKLAGLACQFKRFGELCRRSCGLCPTTAVTPPPPTIPTSTCEDHHPTSECQKLASQACHFRRFGELCRRTCGLCWILCKPFGKNQLANYGYFHWIKIVGLIVVTF